VAAHARRRQAAPGRRRLVMHQLNMHHDTVIIG
jgi:hypothetical protein